MALSIQYATRSDASVLVTGSGFLPSSTLRIDGVAWSNLQFISSTQISFTLAAPMDLTGRLLTVTNRDGSAASYYVSFDGQSTLLSFNGVTGIQPILPSTLYISAGLTSPGTYVFENPKKEISQVTSQVGYSPMCDNVSFSQMLFVPPSRITQFTQLGSPQTCLSDIVPSNPGFSFTASAPIHAIELTPSQSPGAIASGVQGVEIDGPGPGAERLFIFNLSRFVAAFHYLGAREC